MNQSRREVNDLRNLSAEEKAWLIIFLFSLCFLLLGYCEDGYAGSVESRYAFPYHNYERAGRAETRYWVNEYRIQRYKNRLFWHGFWDPVPCFPTSKPWAINTWNYRIIRQHERWHRREEKWQGIQVPEQKKR